MLKTLSLTSATPVSTSRQTTALRPALQSAAMDSVQFGSAKTDRAADNQKLINLLSDNPLVEGKTAIDILQWFYETHEAYIQEMLQRYESSERTEWETEGHDPWEAYSQKIDSGNYEIAFHFSHILAELGLLENTNNPAFPQYRLSAKGEALLRERRPELFQGGNL